jgi:hypothetical protein
MLHTILLALTASIAPSPAPSRPKLVVVITVDQLRPDYLARWRAQFTGGLATLLAEGAIFSNAFQDHAVTETAPGHSTVLSGRWPAHTGIIRNSEGVQDSTAPLIGVAGPGASPRRFRGTALYDWMLASDTLSRALSVSRKDRGAILPIGRAKAQVYWYQSGLFTTSRYYADSLPAWAQAFNALRLPFKSAGAVWTLLRPDSAYSEPDSAPWENGGRGTTFPHQLPGDSARAATALAGVPEMDSLTLAFALAGVEALKLGRRGPTDLLAVSLSATDAIGHTFGPDSREIHDQVLRLDGYLQWFLQRLFDRVGRQNLVVVLTADHAVTPYPEASRLQGHPDAHWVDIDTLIRAANTQLTRLGSEDTAKHWLDFDTGILFLQDNGRLAASGANLDTLLATLATRIRAVPGVARVDRPADLTRADTAEDPVARRWLHHVAGDSRVALVVSLRPFDAWGSASGIAQHGQPSDLDAHVPLILWGRGIQRGAYDKRANTVDIAPTLAQLLGLSPFSLLDGRVLKEGLEPTR